MMSRQRISRVLGQLGLVQVRHVSPVRLGSATGLVGSVYAEAEREFGVLAPPLALHSPAPPVLAASWLMLRETLIATGLVERPVKEAVAAVISRGNGCPFCVTIHDSTLSALTGLTGKGTGDRPQAATRWAEACRTQPGALRYEPACPVSQAPELIGTVVLLQYLNRMVNVFLGDVPLPPGAPRLALGPVMRVLAGLIRSAAAEPHPPGTSLDLLPAAGSRPTAGSRPAAGDARWAAASPVIAAAFARARAAIDAAGARSVPLAVRDAVRAELAEWGGEPRGPSRAWADDAVRRLPAGQRAAGRLALLTALASYQVDRSVIASFRREQPGDAALVELTAWASFAAASLAGSWIPVVQHSAATSAGPP